MGGLSHLTRNSDGPPMSPGYPHGDLIAALFGTYSVMVALCHLDTRVGKEQMIDLALYGAVFRLPDFDPIEFDQLKSIHTRTGNRVDYAVPSSTFRTSDDKYIFLSISHEADHLCLDDLSGQEKTYSSRDVSGGDGSGGTVQGTDLIG